ncbi:hypothetical protein FC40_GL000436 [Ligilactobacillus hayakitensis DSM 18933 = JCM 14209]|uniref:ABC-2 type transporter transmembrane domain-containing protein n=1 Tax=Ligilactobacillus hayakitensis DSM 18933 = JCM 14209 TaxID=1423755 RepID=A0A0R1WMQ5_9LACO|nr:ABC transporter permease [Ligilactobacillus hayakitensis]KRM19143.1 hypothetical protein FC40_GL000436 [Ligilactobacillus hayakitensis DSM 18933 = JCM 14209]
MKFHQIFAIIRHEWSLNLKNGIFWNGVVVPLIFILLSLYHFKDDILNLSENGLLHVIYQILPLFTFYFCVFYTSVLANEVVNDKSSRISEIMLSIVDAKTQIVGKFLGVLTLLFAHITVYFVIISYVSGILGFNIIKVLVLGQQQYILLLIISMILTLISCLIWTVEIGVFVNDKEQTFLAIMPSLFLTGQATLLSWYLVLNSGGEVDLITHILFDIPACAPAIGSVIITTLVSNYNFTYFEAYLTETVQLVFLWLMLKRAIKNYRVGSISNNQRHVLFRNWFK